MSLVSSWTKDYKPPVVKDFIPTWVKRKKKKTVVMSHGEILSHVRSLKGQ